MVREKKDTLVKRKFCPAQNSSYCSFIFFTSLDHKNICHEVRRADNDIEGKTKTSE